MYKKVIFGPLTRSVNGELKDLSVREIVVVSFMVLFIIWIGVYPNPFLKTMEASVQKLLVQTHRLGEMSPNGLPTMSTESVSRLDLTPETIQDKLR